MVLMIAAMALLGMAGASEGSGDTRPAPATVHAFERHVQRVAAEADSRVRGERTFLWADESPARLARLRRGEAVTEPTSARSPIEVPGGLVHDWIGAVFVPGVGLDETLALLQDYDRHKGFYPEVIDSKLVSRDANDFVVFLRLRKKKVITVVLDTTHEARYVIPDAGRAYSHSRTTRVEEVQDAATPRERRLPAGEGRGFMWALDSYWRFLARDGGVYVECEAVSLSRSIPFGLGWLVGPVVNDLPRESLANTLLATRRALTR